MAARAQGAAADDNAALLAFALDGLQGGANVQFADAAEEDRMLLRGSGSDSDSSSDGDEHEDDELAQWHLDRMAPFDIVVDPPRST